MSIESIKRRLEDHERIDELVKAVDDLIKLVEHLKGRIADLEDQSEQWHWQAMGDDQASD